MRRVGALTPQLRQRPRAVALGEALAIRTHEQRMMVVSRGRQVQQRLEQAMDMRPLEQVDTANDVGNALRRIIDSDGEMIGGRRLLAGEDDVAGLCRVGLDPAGAFVMPV